MQSGLLCRTTAQSTCCCHAPGLARLVFHYVRIVGDQQLRTAEAKAEDLVVHDAAEAAALSDELERLRMHDGQV